MFGEMKVLSQKYCVIEKFAINLSSQSKLIMMTRFYAYYFLTSISTEIEAGSGMRKILMISK